MIDLLLSIKKTEGVKGIFDGRWLQYALLAISTSTHEAAGHSLAEIKLFSEEGVIVIIIVLLYGTFTDVFHVYFVLLYWDAAAARGNSLY